MIQRYRKSVLTCLGFIAALVVLIKPGSVDYLDIQAANLFYYYGIVAVATAAVCLYVRYVHVDVAGVLALLLCGFVLATTLYHHGDMNLWWRKWFVFFITVLLTSYGCRHHPRSFIAAVFAVSFAYSLINVASMALFPEGLYGSSYTPQGDNFFLGHRNNVYQVTILSIGAGFMLGAIRGKRYYACGLMAIVVGIVQLYLAPSATSAVALAVMALFLAVIFVRKIRPLCNVFVFLGGYIAFYVAIVLGRMQELAAPLIVDVLHKDLTLTGRTFIWDVALSKLCGKELLIGYGTSGYRELTIDWHPYAHAHNEALNLALVGGLPSVFLMGALLVYPAVRLCRVITSKLAAMVALMIGCFLVVGWTEVVDCAPFFLALTLGCCIPLEFLKDPSENTNGAEQEMSQPI